MKMTGIGDAIHGESNLDLVVKEDLSEKNI